MGEDEVELEDEAPLLHLLHLLPLLHLLHLLRLLQGEVEVEGEAEADR